MSSTDVSCNGGADGTATAIPAGGTSPYSYLWDGGLSPNDALDTGLVAGTYTIQVTDSNGCIGISPNSITVNEPTPLVTMIASITNVDCNGNATGSASVSTSGGTSSYSYSWDNGAGTSATASGLIAGTYTVTTTDANGCTDSDVVTITEPSLPLTTTTGQKNDRCFGNNEGIAAVYPSGGTGPYTYLWTGDGVGTNDSLTGLAGGNYYVTVTDSNGCTAKDTVIVLEPTEVIFNPTTNLATCGNANGSLYMTFSGGTAPYTYQWNGGAPQDLNLLNVVAGVYTFTVVDDSACVDSILVALQEIVGAQVTISINNVVDVACYGDSSGSATASFSGGTGTILYAWSKPDGTLIDSALTINNLPIGTYIFTTTDDNNCQGIGVQTIEQPPAINSATSGTNISCNGGSDGTAQVFASGGTPGYTYSWSPDGGTTDSIGGIGAGQHVITITDANGCQLNDTVNLTEPAPLGITMSGTDISCFGFTDGVAVGTVTGGTPLTGGSEDYSYSWSPDMGSNDTITGLSSGTYTITATDANGCQITDNVTLSEPPVPLTSSIVGTDVNCFGGSDGNAVVSPNGGTSPYTYLWNNGDVDNTANAVVAGTYTVTVTDNHGCTTSSSITLNEPTQLVSNITSFSNVNCNGGNDGQATVSTSGGSTAYSYSWSPSGGIGTTASGLSANTYTVVTTDAHGCTDSDNVTISEPALPLTSTTAQVDNLCFGDADGIAIVIPNGGTSPYTYLWGPTTGIDDSLTGLVAGTYTITVTDTNGCTTTNSVTITEPSLLTVSTSPTDVLCNGGSDGSVLATVAGGTGSYSYQWNNSDNANPTTGLTIGTYSVVVTDANGCTATSSSDVNQPTLLTTSASSIDALCNGDANGQVSVTAAGGTPVYGYSWSDGGTTDTESGIVAGVYTVTVTDNNGCISIDSAEVTEPLQLDMSITKTDVLCNGGNDGSAQALVSGGTLPYTYSWSNGDLDSNNTNLTAGTYTVDVTDANGCTISGSITINEPTALVAVMGGVDINCYQGSDGQASVSVSGGSPSYTYAWTPGSYGTDTITGLTAGTYTVEVTDDHGCTITDNVTLNEPAAGLTVSLTETDVLCKGGSDGNAVVTANGGTSPYTYLWDNGDLDNTANGVTAGTYTVTVTDDHGCTKTGSITVSEPPLLVSDITSFSNVNCNGGSDGTAVVSTGGGTSAYTYAWDNGAGSSASASGLAANTYIVTTTDNNGCTDSDTITISEPALPLTSTTAQVDNLCFGDADGIAIVIPNGGTSPYTYLWGPTTGIDDSLTGLVAGTYTITVTDTNGCTTTNSVTITEPSLLTVSTSPTDVLCNGGSDGSVLATVAGGTGSYSYQWNNSDNANPTTGLTIGTYSVVVTDANGCTATSSSDVNQPTLLTTSASSIDALCNGDANGQVSVTAAGGTPVYGYSWSDGGTTDTESGIVAGVYTVTVTDNNGCISIDSAEVTEPLQLDMSITKTDVLCNGGNDGSAQALVSGGTLPYTYSWSNGDLDSNNTNLTAGTYTVDVTDANGCTISGSITINEPTALVLTTSQQNVNCYGGNDGLAVVSVSGGTPDYVYSWTNGNETDSAVALIAGSYTVTVTDGHNCVDQATVSITEPAAPLSISLTGTDISCNGFSDGQVTANVSGGTTPYNYAWSNSSTSMAISGLIIGNYGANIIDANGCTIADDITLTEPSPLTTSIVNVVNTFCELNNGGALITATGGTLPYSFQWDNPANDTTAQIANQYQGFYTVVTTDGNGCTNTDTVTITNTPSPHVFVISHTDVSCFGGNDGTALATGTLGVTPYSFMWAPSGNSQDTATNLYAGWQYVTLTDANGCTAIDSVEITQPPQLTVDNDSIIKVSCYGYSDGEIYISVSGGTGSYSYSWNTGSVTNHEDSLAIGLYTVTITDDFGCVLNHNVAMPQPPQLVAFMGSAIDESCIGYGDGTASVFVYGGTPAYTYSWNTTPSQNGITATGLVPGDYMVTVIDSMGCVDTATATIGSPSPVITVAMDDATICYGDSIDLTAVGSGGTGTFIYFWSEGLELDNPARVSPMQETTYQVNAIDGHGCIGDPDEVTISVEAIFDSTFSVNANSPICPGTSTYLYAMLSGNPGPVTYQWNEGITDNGPGSFQMYPAQPTWYVATVTNQCGVVLTDSVFVDFKPIPTVIFYADTVEGCQPLEIMFVDSSTTPVDQIVSWNWDFGNGDTSTDQFPVYTFENDGDYDVTLTVTTNAGCVSDSTEPGLITVHPLPVADFDTENSVYSSYDMEVHYVNLSEGASSYDWDLGDGNTSVLENPINTYPEEGEYEVTLTAITQYGCIDEITKPLIIRTEYSLYVPNTFTPDGDGVNDYFFAEGMGLNEEQFSLWIYDRWGELIFFTQRFTDKWDGRVKGNMAEEGTYVWMIKTPNENGIMTTYRGHVNLLR